MTEDIYTTIETIREQMLEYLFNPKRIVKWNKDKAVELNDKWNFMFNYPRVFNKYKNAKTSIIDLSSTVIEILEKNMDRVIHPGLLVLCYQKLKNYISYHYVYNSDGEPIYLSISKGGKLKTLRSQIIVTFQIYTKLFTDNNIKEFFAINHSNGLLVSIRNSLFFNFEIENMISMDTNLYDSCNVRFSDICINLNINRDIYFTHVKQNMIEKKLRDKTDKELSDTHVDYLARIIIEINEGHHVPVVDNIRKLNIYHETGKLSLDYSIVDTSFMVFYRKLIKEIGKVIYKNYDEKNGIIFNLCCVELFDITLAEYFCEIYYKTVVNNVGIPIKEVITVLKSLGCCSKFTETNIMEELDEKLSFIKYDKDNFEESLLTSVGVDQLMLLPQKKQFKRKIEVVSQYTNFREKVFNSILEFFNNDEESVYVFKLIKHINQMTQITNSVIKPIIGVLLDKLDKDTINRIETKHNVGIFKVVPFLIKSSSRYDNIDKNILINLVNSQIGADIREKIEPGKPLLTNCRILPPNIIKDIINNNI